MRMCSVRSCMIVTEVRSRIGCVPLMWLLKVVRCLYFFFFFQAEDGIRDPADAFVGGRPRGREIVADSGDVENPAAVRDQLIASHRRSSVEDERAVRLRFLDSFDRRPDVI